MIGYSVELTREQQRQIREQEAIEFNKNLIQDVNKFIDGTYILYTSPRKNLISANRRTIRRRFFNWIHHYNEFVITFGDEIIELEFVSNYVSLRHAEQLAKQLLGFMPEKQIRISASGFSYGDY